MSNKIKAAIRVRPFLSSEIKNGYKNTRMTIDKGRKQIMVLDEGVKRAFHFDYLFSEEHSQDDVYKGCKIDHMVDKALEGYHSTIFAYGQTGSGKTFTMQGSESLQQNKKSVFDGLIPRVIKELYHKMESSSHRTFSVAVSFLQIYNEKIFDLLNPSSLNPKNIGTGINGLRLRWNKDEQFSVENLFVFECKNSEELNKYFMYGIKNRISCAHKLNVQSSRSHSILTIRIESFDHMNPTHVLCSKIELVDLAGSERIGLTGTEGKLAKESIDINKSLFTLRQVISILAEASKSKGKDRGYVPYRDSKLTSILKQSIGGNSYALMIACINPNDNFLEENLSTLTYATKASYITNQPVINDDPKSKVITDLKKQIKNLTEELSKANQHIQLISTMQQKPPTHHHQSRGYPATQNSQRLSEDAEQLSIPEPIFKKKSTQGNQGGHEQFSERLVESINMVRQLLKSNKELREQLEANNQRLDEKDVEIYELTKQNEELKDKLQGEGIPMTEDSRRFSNSNFRPRNTGQLSGSGGKVPGNVVTNSNIYGFQTANSKNNFNYWNSVEINQYYMNEKGIDSMPTNFNRREVNSAQNNRIIIQSRGHTSDKYDRHAITAKTTKRNWMSKNSEPKKFLSFYNDPSVKDGNFY